MWRRNPWMDRVQILYRYRGPGRIKFGDDRLRGFWLVGFQNSPFPIDFTGRPYNSATL